MQAEIVAPANVDAVWPLISDKITRCLRKAPSDLTAGDYWTMCRSGMAFLIVIVSDNRIVSATIWRFEGQKFCCLLLVGENANLWIKTLYDKAGEMAKQGGAIGLNASGRVGLYRKLKKILPHVRLDRCTYEVKI